MPTKKSSAKPPDEPVVLPSSDDAWARQKRDFEHYDERQERNRQRSFDMAYALVARFRAEGATHVRVGDVEVAFSRTVVPGEAASTPTSEHVEPTKKPMTEAEREAYRLKVLTHSA